MVEAEVKEDVVAQAEEEKKEAPALEGKMAEFVDWIEGISVLDLSVLVKALEDRLGVTAAAPAVAVAAGAMPVLVAVLRKSSLNSPLCSLHSANRRLRLSRKCVASPVLDSRIPRIWSKALRKR